MLSQTDKIKNYLNRRKEIYAKLPSNKRGEYTIETRNKILKRFNLTKKEFTDILSEIRGLK